MKIDRRNFSAINFALCIYASFTDAIFLALRCKINRRATNARERGLTLRQVALEAASPRPLFAGTPQEVADGLQLWFEQRGADGFIIQGGTPDTFPRFVDRVVPILQARGLFRREYPGTTLRESLGLTQPVNQFQQQ